MIAAAVAAIMILSIMVIILELRLRGITYEVELIQRRVDELEARRTLVNPRPLPRKEQP
jgi:hypothetical protein